MRQIEPIDIPPKVKKGLITLMNKLNRDKRYKDNEVVDIQIEKRITGDEIYTTTSTFLTLMITNHRPTKDYSAEMYWGELFRNACDYLGHPEYKRLDDGEIIPV